MDKNEKASSFFTIDKFGNRISFSSSPTTHDDFDDEDSQSRMSSRGIIIRIRTSSIHSLLFTLLLSLQILKKI